MHPQEIPVVRRGSVHIIPTREWHKLNKEANTKAKREALAEQVKRQSATL